MKQTERGQTAILSVIFFTILMMILTVSFMHVVTAEQSQTTNNELEASALAAAESGIEDAKRVVSYCMTNPNDSACINAGLYSIKATPGCSDLINSGVIAKSTKVSAPIETVDGTQQVKVGANGSYNQYYSCLIINMVTKDYIGTRLDASTGQSEVVPLTNIVNTNGQPVKPAYIAVQWHSTQASGDGSDGDGVINASDLLAGSDLPSLNTYNSKARPAVLRAELAKVPHGNISLTQLANDARAVTIRPSQSDSAGSMALTGELAINFPGGKAYVLETWKPSTSPNTMTPPLLLRNCQTPVGGYQCNVVLTNSATSAEFDTINNDYYLRLQAIYRNAQFRVTVYDKSGKQLYFDSSNPSVDVTGRAGDSFKRLNARLEPANGSDGGAGSWFPEYAIDSGGKVCKQLSVVDNSGTDNCSY